MWIYAVHSDLPFYSLKPTFCVNMSVSFASMSGNTVQLCSAPVSPSVHQVGFPTRGLNLPHPKYCFPPIFSPDKRKTESITTSPTNGTRVSHSFNLQLLN